MYSSIESTLTLPSSLISVLKLLTLLCVNATFSGFWYCSALLGVSSYSSHILLIIPLISSSIFVFLTSNFTSWPFKSSITLNLAVISSSCFESFSLFWALSFFNSSIFELLLFTLSLTSSIFWSVSCIDFSSSSLSFLICSICAFLFSILVCAFSNSWLILSWISWIDASLSSNEDTEIFKFVMSKFKSSMYFWSSLFNSANSVIILESSSFCSTILFISTCKSPFVETASSFCFSRFACSSFSLFKRFSSFSIFSFIEITFCFSVAYVMSISCSSFSRFEDNSKIPSIDSS